MNRFKRDRFIHPFTHSPIHPFTHSPIHPFTQAKDNLMNSIVYLVGAVVIIAVILSFLGLR